MKYLARSLALAGLVVSLGACDYITDLDTENLNQPDLRRVLTNSGDVESMIASSWLAYWKYEVGSSTHNAATSAMAHEMTSTVANWDVLQISAEPRNWEFNNHPAGNERFFNQAPWYHWYGGLASVNDGLKLINEGMVIRENQGGESVDVTQRAVAFGKFMQGVLLAKYAFNYDQAMIVTEDTDLETETPEYQPYTAVADAAIASLEEAIQISQANDFVLPDSWIEGLAVSDEELVRIAHSYIARILVYQVRTPQEAESIDWNRVLTHLDQGIQEDHAPILVRGESGIVNWYRLRTQHGWFRIDYRTIGPADVSGQYQEWINAPASERSWFTMETPDKRIAGENRTTDRGKWFRQTTNPGVLREDRGLYNWSQYRFDRWGRGRAAREGPQEIMPLIEMEMLRAEAYMNLGREAEAAEIVSRTRVEHGELPPVTADGVPQDADCIPRTTTGACGSLWDALMYEKHLETIGTFGDLAWYDRRRWGTLATGTLLHMPVPGRELETLGLPLYSFGGGGPGSAQ